MKPVVFSLIKIKTSSVLVGSGLYYFNVMSDLHESCTTIKAFSSPELGNKWRGLSLSRCVYSFSSHSNGLL